MWRSLAVLSLLVGAVLAPPVHAQDAFKWDTLVKRKPAVGDRYFQVNEDIQQIKSKIAHAKDETDESSFSSMKFRVVHEILGVEGDKISKERITIERWAVQKEEKEPEDKSLSGKTILIEGAGDKKKVTWENGSDTVSEDGKRWVDVTFARADPMDQIEKLLPTKPVGNGAEWDLPLKKLADEVFPGTEIDEAKSSAKGTLKNVRVEDGVHLGDVEIKVALQLKHIPNANPPVAWKEGGLVELVVTIQGSLEPEKSRKRAVKMELKLKGRAEQDAADGMINVKMDMKMSTSFTSGDMPKK